LVHKAAAFAVAMDIDAAGLPFLKNMTPPAGGKSVDELRRISEIAGVPFIVKGIMNIKSALKAKEAGAKAIVVSNHGGRVLDQCPSTAEVLPEIAEAVGSEMKILVDGGIRSGTDIFKALALGADGVLICRPFVTAVYGGEKEGVKIYIEKLAEELKDTMAMCGAFSLIEITKDMIYDTMDGRFIDNANFFQLNDLNKISDEELYDRLLAEFPTWLREAKIKRIID